MADTPPLTVVVEQRKERFRVTVVQRVDRRTQVVDHALIVGSRAHARQELAFCPAVRAAAIGSGPGTVAGPRSDFAGLPFVTVPTSMYEACVIEGAP